MLDSVFVIALFVAGAGPGPQAPPGFTVEIAAQGFSGATALACAPDGTIFVCEQTGAVKIVKDGKLLEKPFVSLEVDSFWERGVIGIALDPDFPANGYVYINHVVAKPFPHHRISRFKSQGNTAEPGSETILFEGDNQDAVRGEVKAGHQGGGIHFGKDGKLYVAVGEQTAGAPAQALDSLLGKLLRLNPDGTIPSDNPLLDKTQGKCRSIYALGLRNPFGFAVQPGSGRIFINDVGGNFEEVNEAFPGANYGWPANDHGPPQDPRFRGPIHWYPTSSITGGAFCPNSPAFPPNLRGRYLFCDFMKGWIKTLDPDHPRSATDFISGLAGPVDLAFTEQGRLLILARNMWVRDQNFKPGTGTLHRLTYDPAKAKDYVKPRPRMLEAAGPSRDIPVPLDAEGFPPALSQMHVFKSLGTLEPAQGVLAYDVIAPLWSDGARKRRFIVLPKGASIGFRATGEWTFPKGAMFVKHFELPLDDADPNRVRRLETRFLVADGAGSGVGVTYRWREDGKEADLLASAADETLNIQDTHSVSRRLWTYPGRDDCLKCHTTTSGFILGVKARQLNREFLADRTGRSENQLRVWNRLGLFDRLLDESSLGSIERLADPLDRSAPVELRVRSYLDANCSNCHRPGANIPAAFDARFEAPSGLGNLLSAPRVSDALGVEGGRLIDPGRPERSLVYLRMTQEERYKMPPLARSLVDQEAAEVIRAWISSLR